MLRWILLIAVLWLQGCSAIKLGYQQLPSLSYWWLDSAVSFSDPQAALAKDALAQLHRWHRTEELPAYADLLKRLAAQTAEPLQAQQVCRAWDEIDQAMDRTLRKAVSLAAPVAMALGPEQLNHLSQYWTSKNQEWDKEWAQGSASERLERRQNKAVERYSDFYGPLSPAQTAMVKAQLLQSAWTPEWGQRDRLRRHQDLLSALQKASQSSASALPKVEADLWDVWQRWLSPPDATGRAVVQKMVQQGCDNLAQLHNSTSPEQRQRAARRLRAYEQDLRDLIRP
ncbi:MAG: DUF6279 family lipoprotein [Limnohabitans sp.]